MKIVTSPMCEEILKLCNIENYTVSKYPDTLEDVTIAITLSETKTQCPSIKLKLNTPEQIIESIETISSYFNKETKLETVFNTYSKLKETIRDLENHRKENKEIKVKVYSLFLKEIITDLGYSIDDKNYEYIVYPDYMREKIENEDKTLIEISSHNTVSKNPIIRCLNRYEFILENIK